MKADVSSSDSALTFEALGRTLELMDGEKWRFGLAFITERGSGEMTLLGGLDGVLRMADEDTVRREADASPERVHDTDEGAYLFEIGPMMVALFEAEFVGASYTGGALKLHCGPLLMTLTKAAEGSSS